jgi:hypothetical protein
MITGKEWEGPAVVEGIKVQKVCRLLGVQVDDRVSRLNSNWENCVVKIQGLVNYWNQYNLTVVGRVLVAKTFLLSQVTFLLGIIPADDGVLDRIESIIEWFTLGKLQIARDRIYNKLEQGGIGLLKLKDLDVAMKCAWVNRWNKEGQNVDITGGRVLNTARNEKIEYINKDLIQKHVHPCARSVAEAWHIFRGKVYENDGNLYSGNLFSNPGMRNRMGDMIGGGNIFSQAKYDNIRERLWDIPLGVFCLEEGIRERDELQMMLGVDINNREYGKLRDSIKYLRGKFKPVWDLRGTGKNIEDWLHPIKKGSGKIRNLMMGRGSRVYRNFKFSNIRPISTLWTQMGIEIDDTLLSMSMTLWDTKEVDTEFRQFTFKWNQGMVHGNTVISHFGDVDRKCTFCKMDSDEANGGRDIPEENRPHIFWDCPTVSYTIRTVYKEVWGWEGQLEKRDFLMGRIMGQVESTQLYMLINMYIKYKIWKYGNINWQMLNLG